MHMQDLPDVEGDKKFNIDTFAGKYGVSAVANVAATSLSTAYLTAIIIPLVHPNHFRVLPMVLGHTMYLLYFLWGWKNLDGNDMNSVKRFYKIIWNLFYLEYCLYPFI